MLKVISNIMWILFGGIWLALSWCVCGVILCITIVGIPFGVQCFKLAKLSFAPIGKKVKLNIEKHPIANTVWAIVGGWAMAILHFLICVINCITIIGISRGIQCFKIMKLAFFPFGAKVK